MYVLEQAIWDKGCERDSVRALVLYRKNRMIRNASFQNNCPVNLSLFDSTNLATSTEKHTFTKLVVSSRRKHYFWQCSLCAQLKFKKDTNFKIDIFVTFFKRSAPFCKSGNVEKCVSFQTDTDPTSCWVFAPLYPWHLAASLAAHLVHSDASFEFCTRLHETRRKTTQWK